MKKILFFIVNLIGLSIILYVIFTKADFDNFNSNELLEIGEEKYLEFLWMTDGVFNKEKSNVENKVNGKIISDDKKVFTCEYKNNVCISSNFVDEFQNLFANNIKYDKVYGDGLTYTWVEYKNDKYYFEYPNN